MESNEHGLSQEPKVMERYYLLGFHEVTNKWSVTVSEEIANTTKYSSHLGQKFPEKYIE